MANTTPDPQRPTVLSLARRPHAVPEAARKEDELDLFEFAWHLWNSKLLILAAALAMAGLAAYYAFAVAVPQYTTTARLILEVRSQQVVDIESVISGVSTEESAINTELEIITSHRLLEALARDLDLVEDPEFNGLLREDDGFSLGALIGAGVRTARTLLGTGGEAEAPEPLTDEDILLGVTSALQGAVRATALRDTYIIEIHVTTGDPDKSVRIANRLAEIYLDDQVATKFAATEYAVTWLSDRVESLELELREKEDALKELQNSTELISQDGLELLSLQIKDIRERLENAREAAQTAAVALTRIETVSGLDDPAAVARELGDPALTRLLAGVERGESGARQAFGARVDTLLAQAEAAVARASQQMETLSRSYDDLQRQFETQSADLAQITQLAREAEVTRALYTTFLTRLKETSVQIGLQQADSRIMQPALEGYQSAPRTMRIVALGLIFGALLGAAIALLRKMRRNSFHSSGEIEAATGETVLAQVPLMPIRRRHELLAYLRDKPTSVAVEAIRNLRTSILMSNMDAPPQVILSTSSVPGEGKTTHAIALAHNLAGLEKRVLLIEGDIRRRTLQHYFKDTGTGDLLPLLNGEIPLERAVTHHEGLGADLLMSSEAKINAADLFSSNRFREMLDSLRERYDFIIIDAPPVLVVPDARILGRLSDAIIYSVHWDKTPKAQVLQGLREFSSVGLAVTGIVLARVNQATMRRYSYGAQYGAYTGEQSGYYTN